MLNYSILAKKGNLYYTDENNKEEKFIDLLSKTTNDVSKINIRDVIIVNEYYVARPDLISLAVYGTDEYADIICKVNGISNPFELNENDILLIPDLSHLSKFVSMQEKHSELIDESSDIIVTKKYPYQKDINEKRSPMESVNGEELYIIDKSHGVIFY